MAVEKGLTCLLLVGDTATAPTTYVALEGQVDTSFEGSSELADTTDKTSGGWKTGMATVRSGSVSVSGNLYDAASRAKYDQLYAAWLGGTTHACKIVFDTAGTGFTGDFSVSSFTVSGSASDAAKYSLSLTPVAALAAVP